MKANGSLALDTNAVIAYREGTPGVCDLIENADAIILPVIVLGELLYGAANSARSQENERIVHKFLAQCAIIPIDQNVAVRYADVRLQLKKAGRPIPENDVWVAAICLEFDLTLLTLDAHFDYIPGLRVVKWAI